MRARAGRLRLPSFAALCLVLAVATAHAEETPAYKPGEVLVKFRAGAASARIRSLSTAIGGDVVRTFPKLGIQKMTISKGTVEQAIAVLRADPAVEFAEPNYILHAFLTPNDPLYPQLWGMSNTGQTGGTPGADIHAPQAWSVFTGSSSVLVGVIDTGIDYNHPDLAANIWTNPGEIAGNGIDDDSNGFVDDVHGWDFVNNDNDPMDDHYHGTHCAGTIGAVGDNGIGVAGVSWSVKIAAIKFLDSGGSGSTDGAIAAIDYAARIGVKVINASWGGGGYSEALRLSIAAAGEAGVLFVAAAGNSGVNTDFSPNYPSSYDLDCIVAVAATDANDQLAFFSNFGVATVDLAAPGVDILSTQPGNRYQYLSGTSMATPHVVGAAALIRGRFPGASPLATKQLLLLRAQPRPSLTGKVLTGARLDAYGSISDPDSIPPAAVTDLAADQADGERVRLRWTAPGDDGATGTAFEYDVRYSTAPIDADNFAAATPATLEPSPGPAGTQEQMIVHGLDFATTYHFAIRARDEFGNTSPVSNDAFATTLGPPDIAVAPDSLSADLLTGAKTSRVVTISNTGQGELVFTIEHESLDSATRVDVLTSHADVPDAVLATGVPVPLASLAGIPLRRTIDPGQYGAPDLAGVLKPSAVSPGRHVFGHDEEVFGAPQNNYYGGPRIRGNIFHCTTSRRLREHRFYLQVDTPTPLWFLVYESAAQVGSFSLVSASNVSPAAPGTGWYSSGPIDLELVEGHYYLIVASFEQPSGYFNQIGISPYPIPASFGTLIAGAGASWAAEPSYPPSPTITVPDYAYGDDVAYYQTIVTDDRLTWIAAAPESGAVAGGGQLDLAVTFDATGLNDGNYDGRLVVHSNDPDEPAVEVATHLHVTGAADIALAPGALDFGTPFVGAVVVDTVEVRNIGTAPLVVTGMTPTPASYTAEFTGAFALAPGEKRKVAVRFAPTAPGAYPGSLTVDSTDPDQPVTVATLSGTALVPPVMGVTPDALAADLLTGQQAVRTVTVTNTGGSNLEFRVSVLGPASSSVRIVHAPEDPAPTSAWPSNRVPPGYKPRAAARLSAFGARVLVVQDALPWGFTALQDVLTADGIAYDAIGSAQLGSTDLGHYDVLIVPSDQFYQTYQNLAASAAQIDAFVTHGGRFEYHAAGYGFNGGEPTLYTLPGGMTVQPDFPSTNVVLLPSHPIAAGVPNPFTGNAASHVRFLNIPANAKAILGNDTGLPNCVQYAHGAGVVVASGQTLEWGYHFGQGAGIVLQNMVPYVCKGGASWLTADPEEGVVPPGGSAQVQVKFDATDLDGGSYDARVHIESNDPLALEVDVPAHLTVTGVADIALRGREHEVVSSQTYQTVGGSTHHVLALPSTPGGEGRMRLTTDGDFNDPGETATLVVEGVTLGHSGEKGYECYPDSTNFPLTDAQLAQFGGDHSVDVTVVNSPTVDAYCYMNRHTVRLHYRDPADRLVFGPVFLGTCRSETLEVANTGTDSLRLGAPVPGHAWYSAVVGNAVVAPRSATSLVVTFCPLASGPAAATLTLPSNDPDEPALVLALDGQGAIAPDIAVMTDLIEVSLDTGAKATRSFAISNAGGPLLWNAFATGPAPPDSTPPPPDSMIVQVTPEFSGGIVHAKADDGPPTARALAAAPSTVASPEPLPDPPSIAGTLESVLTSLDAHSGQVTAAIPNRYDFFEGVFGYGIDDGGADMYDGGNYLLTDLGGYIPYSDGVITTNYAIGPAGRYFTRKYPGLFVFIADFDGVQQFGIVGNLGADGGGSSDGAVIDIVNGGRYRLFIKRVYNAYDPSVNHLIIVPDGQSASHSFDQDTNSDGHFIFQPGKRIYDLLYAGNGGAYIDNASAIAIARAFLNAIPGGSGMATLSPKSGGLPGGAQTDVQVTFDAKGLTGGDYPGRIEVVSNDPDEGFVFVPTLLHVHGVADIAAVPESLDFGAQFLGVPAVESLLVRNEGTDVLHVSGVSAAPGAFTVAPASFTLAAGAARVVAVQFVAPAVGPVSGALTITSDDSDEPVLLVPLMGTGVQGVADIAVTPDNLQFGARFVGVASFDTVRVRNVGTAVLHVTGATAAPSVFTVAPGAFDLVPGAQRALAVGFQPAAAGPVSGTLTIASDDFDEPGVAVGLAGSGIMPPTLVISPDSLSASVAPGGQATRVLTLSNPGSSDLFFAISPGWRPNEAARIVRNEPLASRTPSRRAPEGYQAANPPHAPAVGAHVLLIQDVLPFGSTSNQAVLSLNGIAYDQKTTSQIASTNLASYFAVIVASDQNTSSYQTLAARAAQIDAYVQQGGRLEFHAAGFGFNGGDATLVTLPGGMHIEVDTASVNRVLLPGHPIATGVPDPFTGNLASHVRFTSIPAGAQLILGDATGRPNLVSYNHGAGLVVASGQALENGYQYDEPSGRVLENMIPFVADVPSWLRTAPNQASVPPGQHVDVQVIFDAATLLSGLYRGQLLIGSNDPVRPTVIVPATLTVLGASAVTGTEDDAPLTFGLAAVAPTPSHGSARIAFTLSRPGTARAAIYDVAGRVVKTLADGPREAGRHSFLWEGLDERGARCAAGVYLLRLDSAEGRRTRRLVWVP